MSDTPQSTLSRLKKVETKGPYPYVCRNGKDKILFPDPAEMDWLEAEEFIRDFRTKDESVWMKKWLSEEDFDLMLGEKLKGKELAAILMEMVEHYQGQMGDQGE